MSEKVKQKAQKTLSKEAVEAVNPNIIKYAKAILPKVKRGLVAAMMLALDKKEVAMEFMVSGLYPSDLGGTKDYESTIVACVYTGYTHKTTGAHAVTINIPSAKEHIEEILNGLTEEEKASIKLVSVKRVRDTFDYTPVINLLKMNTSLTNDDLRRIWSNLTDEQIEKAKSML